MNEYALKHEFMTESQSPWIDPNQYYSVEIAINRLGIVYQFRIWQVESIFSYILVREDSAMLPWISEGERMNMKYYSNDLKYPYQNLDTEIRDISRQVNGRLRGHYLVGLEIVEARGGVYGSKKYLTGNSDLLRLL